ncbi:hypothetical protein [Aeromicrobium sp. 9AM]|uniref:hypothetical protein n=1 Tax=Aeromicrobium sp. 9AM TaxID=2653126 RepID=UPI0012F06986|nr:hypothetical protein [Aeromicrobium sp. 9AM]VXC20902.1 hypothetical protein AERO9AM_50364 [Aeromicrobium sp. 9AM]
MSVLTIASQNLAAEAKSWQRKTFAGRLDDIGDGIAYYRPGVFLAQETGGGLLYLPRLDREMKRHGLRRAPHGGRWRHIYYNPDLVRRNRSGLMSLNRLGTKHAAWLDFTDRLSDERLFATSVHLSQGNESKAQTRYREGETLLRKTAHLNPRKYPEIHGGDFNSHGLVGRVVFEPRHYVDALDVASTTKHKGYNTYNGRSTVKPIHSTQQIDGDHDDHFYVSSALKPFIAHWSQRPTVVPSDHNLIAIKVRL